MTTDNLQLCLFTVLQSLGWKILQQRERRRYAAFRVLPVDSSLLDFGAIVFRGE